MELCLNQRQLSMLIKGSVNQRLKIYEADATSAPVAGTDPDAAKPSAGTGDTGAKTGYPEVTKWESGVERGADNQIAVTKWSDIVGSKITRGKSNPLTENEITKGDLLTLLEQPNKFNFKPFYTPDGSLIDSPIMVAAQKRPFGSVDADIIYPFTNPSKGYPKKITPKEVEQSVGQQMTRDQMSRGGEDLKKFGDYQKELNAYRAQQKAEDDKPLVNWGGKTLTANDLYGGFTNNPKAEERKKTEENIFHKYYPVNKQKTLLRADDNDMLIVNLWKGEFSEALLDAREYFFETYIGIGAEIAISYGLAEFGGTIAMETMNAMFLFNDTYVMFNNMDVDPSRRLPEDKKGTWESISWLWNNNIDFQNVMVDLCIVLGTIAMKKLSGNLPGVLNFLRSRFPNFMDFIKAINKIKNQLIDLASKGPKKLVGWLRGVFKYFDDFCVMLEKKAATPDKVGKTLVRVAKLPRVLVNAALLLLSIEYGPRTFKVLLRAFGITNSKNLSAEEQSKFESKQPVVVQQQLPKVVNKDVDEANKEVKVILKNNKPAYDKLIYDQLISEGKINCKINEFSVTKEKYDGETVFMITNTKYYINESNVVVQLPINK